MWNPQNYTICFCNKVPQASQKGEHKPDAGGPAGRALEAKDAPHHEAGWLRKEAPRLSQRLGASLGARTGGGSAAWPCRSAAECAKGWDSGHHALPWEGGTRSGPGQGGRAAAVTGQAECGLRGVGEWEGVKYYDTGEGPPHHHTPPSLAYVCIASAHQPWSPPQAFSGLGLCTLARSGMQSSILARPEVAQAKVLPW